MRTLVLVLIFFISPASMAVPIEYSFEGYTSSIILNTGDHDPSSPLVRDDGMVITNGDSFMSGHIVFDPEATRSGAGGSGLGEVLNWTFSTQGLTYYGEGGDFHFLNFDDSSFDYLDEVPSGGYGPDVVHLDFNFNGEPFAQGPDNFPVADFIDGRFSTAIDVAWINDDLTMWGLEGKITDLQVEEFTVPNPSSFSIMIIGFFVIWLTSLVRTRKFTWSY